MKKRRASAHVQKPIFNHSKADSPFIAILDIVSHPRGASPNFSCFLTTVLYIVTTKLNFILF